VTAAISYLEEQAQLRRREEGKILYETTGRILVARFTEHGSHELDPHLHTHLVVLNMTNHENGDRMASLESRVMYAEQRVAGQIYRNSLAFVLRERAETTPIPLRPVRDTRCAGRTDRAILKARRSD
jgi:conjugative relaxase-like TrwC/TraI family protein